MTHIEYFAVLGAILLFPLILSFLMPIRLYTHRRALFFSIGIVCIFYWVWDAIATARGHWSFNPAYVLDIRIAGMPLEEWLFFVVITFVSIFTYEAVRFVIGKLTRK